MTAETMFPLSELDRMLPLSDTALHTAAGSKRGRRSSVRHPSTDPQGREMFAEYRNSQLVGGMKSLGCAPSVADDDLSPDRVARNARGLGRDLR